MKKHLFIFCLSLFCLTTALGQCSDNIRLSTQAEVDAFAEDYNCTEISGNLIIDGISIQSDINNLLGLKNITSILGDLEILDLPNLENFEGLDNLSSIGNFSITNNSGLINFEGLGNLTDINGDFWIFYNANLINFEGLNSLIYIDGNFSVNTNASLINFEGLNSLTNIDGSFSVNTNANLINFEGLESLVRIDGGGFNVQSNNSLINFGGLSSLTTCFELFISFNNKIINFEGLDSLTNIDRGFGIISNHNLVNFEGLNSVTNIAGSIDINFNVNLINFEGLNSLTDIGGRFLVHSNENLINFEGLESLVSIGGGGLGMYYIYIHSNAKLVSLTGLENLRGHEGSSIFEGEYVTIENNPNLWSCCPLLNFQNLSDVVNLYNNAPSCSSLGAILSGCEGVVQSQAFHDENENGVYDDSENYLVQNFSLEPNAAYNYVDQMGINSFYIFEFGNFTLSYENSNPLWTIDSTYNSVELLYQDSTFQDTLVYFPLIPVTNIASQRIDLSSSITRCNRETNYWLTYSNRGTVTTSGIIELIPDNLPEFISSEPPVDSISNDGKLYWFYNDLYPTHSEKIHLIYEMPGVDNLGEIINFEVNIKTNEGYAGHRTILSSELICAYDPNDKLNTPSGYGKENYTLFGDTLEYTIRFQNTGNDTAFNVEIRDELSELLDLRTFQPISSSHNVETQIDLESRIATFKFNDIYLPDSFVNEPASHGFIKYQILGNAGLNENSDIKNTASIYFDENPAIVTNTVNNRMVSELPLMPVVSANPNVLDFGEISLNNPAIEPQILTISNLGDLPLEINAFEFGNAVFDAGELQNLTIEGGKSEEILIYFKPTTVGEYLSELVLVSNSGDLTINLLGKATMATGLTTFHQTKVQIYPNPSEGRFTLKSEGEIIRNLSVQNSLGELILSKRVNNELFEVDLTSESKGLYFIIIETDKGIFVDKVIVY